jgi:hypothetical protein
VCDQAFTLTPNEQKWFIDRGMHLPARCRACRQLKKQQRSHGPDYVAHVPLGRK